MIIDLILLILMTLFTMWAVMAKSLLKAVIGLAFTSAALAIVMFKLNSPFAAVFELSVCTGLITAVFISAITFAKPLTSEEINETTRDRIKRYWPLPVLMIAVMAVLFIIRLPGFFRVASVVTPGEVRDILWNTRQLDLIGQIVVLLAGVFGVIMLFKGASKDE